MASARAKVHLHTNASAPNYRDYVRSAVTYVNKTKTVAERDSFASRRDVSSHGGARHVRA